MLGFAPIGRLAIGQLPSQSTIVNLTATMQVRASARAGMTAPAPLSGRMQARASARAGMTASTAITGVISARAMGRVAPGVNLRSSISARVALRAIGGVVITGRISVRVKGSADKFFVPGSGHSRLPWIPQPAYEVKRAKPFQPIWDRLRQQQLEDARRKAAEPPPPPPLPPRSIFPAIVTLKLDTQLDHLARLIPGDWHKLENSVHEAEDATDAERLLQDHADDAAGDVADAFADLSDASHVILRKVVKAEVNDIGEAFQSVQGVADMLMAAVLKQHESEDMTDVADVMDGLIAGEA